MIITARKTAAIFFSDISRPSLFHFRLILHQPPSTMDDRPGGGGGGALPYLGYTGTCRWIGYGFLASLS